MPKNADFLLKNADISKIKKVLVLKGIFSQTIICMYLRTMVQVSSIILTSFRQWVILLPLPLQNKPLKSPPKFGLRTYDSIQKVATGQGDDYTTGRLLDFN